MRDGTKEISAVACPANRWASAAAGGAAARSDKRSQRARPALLPFCSEFAITLSRMVKRLAPRRVTRPAPCDKTTRGLAALGLRAAAIVLLATFAAAAAPPQNADPALAPWFRSLINPVVGLSCCAESDGHILRESDWRVNGNRYEIRVAGN